MLYPLKFAPVYKDYIWGGRGFERFGRKLPQGKIAESWDLSCHPDGVSIVSEGDLKGVSLPDLIRVYKTKLLGTNFPDSYMSCFPLLVKLIDANDKLSVQVHPNDEYAVVYENGGMGKNEMWYVLDSKPGSKLVYGLNAGVTREIFSEAVRGGTIETCLRYLEVVPGDIVNIPAGVIHAIGEGIMIAEIQQNSNTTYRVYDYNRVDGNGVKRPLHIEQAMNVINFSTSGNKNISGGLKVAINDTCFKSYVVANRFFASEIYEVEGRVLEETDGTKFYIYIFTEGDGDIQYQDGAIRVKAGETILIPASLGSYIIKGNFKALKAYIPNLQLDVVSKLKGSGFNNDSIYGFISASC